jgi:hypothetical protein
VWNRIWTQRHHVHSDLVTEASPILRFFSLFYIYAIISSNSETAVKKKQLQNIHENHHVQFEKI